MVRLSQQFKLALLVGTAVVSMLSFGVYSYSRTKYLLLAEAERSIDAQAATISSTVVASYARNFSDLVRQLSHQPSIIARLKGQDSPPEYLTEWITLKRLHPEIWYIYFADLHGRIWLHPDDGLPDGFQPMNRPWFKAAVATPGTISWCGPYVEIITREHVISTVTTIHDLHTGHVLGVFSMDIAMRQLDEALTAVKLPPASGIMILNASGQVVAASAQGRLLAQELGEPWLRGLLAGGQDGYRSNDGRTLFTSLTDTDVPDWKLALLVPRAELMKGVNPIMHGAFLASMVVMASACALLFLYSRSRAKKVASLTHYMTEVAAGRRDLQRLFAERDEFSLINNRFNEMVMAWREAEDILAQTEMSYRGMVEGAPLGIFRSVPGGHFLSMNGEAARMFGYESPKRAVAAIRNIPADIYATPKDRERFLRELEQHGSIRDFQVQLRRQDGETFWASLSARVTDDGGSPVIDGFITDVSERIRIKEQLEELATRDELTGAWNRRHFLDILQREFSRANRYGHSLSVLLLDADYFKAINDRLGHQAGDRVLQHLVRSIQAAVREVDILGRIGGEEFALLLPETSHAEALELADRLRSILEANPTQGPEGPIHCTMSIGVAALSPQVGSAEILLQIADIRLYEAKSAGRNRVC